ncbi:MAG: hypothetical protein KY460_04620 [Actinobacteria bacterium]|nr:hypothetical protein [Actinomycetota bacterium]
MFVLSLLVQDDAWVTDDGPAMYYAGYDGERVARIGLATSTDGIEWNKHEGPMREADGEWDGGSIGGHRSWRPTAVC